MQMLECIGRQFRACRRPAPVLLLSTQHKHHQGIMKAIHPLLLSLFLSLAASVATVAQPFSFDFSTEDQWLDNFRVRSPDPNHFFWSPDGYVQGWQKPGEEEGEPSALWWGVAIYDTATEEPGYANGTYLDETIVARFSTNTLTADPSFSVF